MTSVAKREWDTTALARLDELERVHHHARRSGSGRRWGTEQLNRSLFVVLVAQFQTYARNLHDEAIDIHATVANPRQADVVRRLLTQGRKLDAQNPQPAALGSDFGRFGFDLVPGLVAQGSRMEEALAQLEVLVRFRNAIAHGNESALAAIVASGQITPTLTSFRAYRRALNRLVGTMDRVAATELAAVLQIPPPW
jgi:hypothetical protein